MFNRSFISVLIVTSAFTIVFGQTPEPKKEKAPESKSFAFAFDGDGGYLGVQTEEVSKENFAKFGLREVRGVAIEEVLENSPAAAAGMRDGDVIVRFNGEPVTSSRKLTRLVSEVAPDHQVKLTILRGGSEQEVTATVGKRPAPAFGSGSYAFPSTGPMGKIDLERLKDLPQMKDFPDLKDFPKGEGFRTFSIPGGEGKAFTWSSGTSRQIGVGVYPVTKQLAERFGVDGGVMINEVRADSPAAKAGLKAGDIIVEVDGKTVKGDLDLIKAINEKKEGSINVTIVRDRNRQTISVTPEPSKDGGFLFRPGDDSEGRSFAPMIDQLRLAPPTIPSGQMTAPTPLRSFAWPGRII
ncbi:MAG: PDZ domain-containing protein [Pyrinomonadaceae bacterium]